MSILYFIALLSPIFFSISRKLLPDQPNYVEPLGIGVVLLVGIIALTRRSSFPRFLAIPLIIWAVFQGFYAFLSLFYDIRVGAAGFFINVLPMLMALIAYEGTHGLRELKWIGWTLGVLAVILLPFGIYVAIYGNTGLPPLLLPNVDMLELGKDIRAGLPAYAGVFSTQDVLSMAFMAVYFISLALFLGRLERDSFRWLCLAFSITAFVLVLLSTRRGGLLGIVAGSFFIVLTGNINWKQRVSFALSGVLSVLVIVFLDSYFSIVYKEETTRVFHALNLDLWVRFKVFFWDVCAYWASYNPWGSYLGNGGSEGIVFGSDIFLSGKMVETGGAKLIAEMGVLGGILMPVLLLYVHCKIFFMKTARHIHAVVRVLFAYNFVFYILYYFKEWTAMSGGYFSQLLFWAIPGICYALIEQERKKRSMHFVPIPIMYIDERGEEMPYGPPPPQYGPPHPPRGGLPRPPGELSGQTYPR